MTDDDLARALRALDPARTHPDAPVPLAAERRLREILADDTVDARPARRRFPVAVTAAAASIAIVIAVVVGLVWAPAPSASALTPAPLQYTEIAADVATVIDAARTRLRDDPERDAPERRSLSLGWYFSGSPDDATATVFRREWIDVRWDADLSGSVVTTVAESTDADGDTVPADDPAPGTVVGDLRFVRGQFAPQEKDAPAATVEAMRAVVRHSTGAGDPLSAGDAITGTRTLLGEWTLSAAQEAALLQMVAEATGARVLGATSDRLGRAAIGIGGVPSALPGVDMTLLLSPDTGRILGTEAALRDGEESLGLPAGSVTEYTLWGVESRKAAEG